MRLLFTGTHDPELYRYGYHARDCWVNLTVARQVEGLHPQPPQKFKVADSLKWVKGQASARPLIS